MYERIGGFTAHRFSIPSGDRGTRMTLGYMQGEAVAGSRDWEVRAAAIEALDRAGVRDHDPAAALYALHRFVRDRIRFVHDPVGTQAIQSPRATLSVMAGNCAQKATLLAALARSIGIPTRFRVIAANRRFPNTFSHVYVIANVRGRQVALDPTYRSNAPGYEYPDRTRIGDFLP